MKILVRLPNWLGDMVMSAAFVEQLGNYFPGAEVSVIVKNGLEQLLDFFPPIRDRFIFSKDESAGLQGLFRFGRKIKSTKQFDVFFCLPNSFSSAFMGYTAGIKKRVGYKKELRQIFLTHAYNPPKDLHRVQEYVRLLELFTGQQTDNIRVRLKNNFKPDEYVVVNINSEASSRRLTHDKAVEIISAVKREIDLPVKLIGSSKEKPFVDSILNSLPDKSNIDNVAGKTSLKKLVEMLASARLLLTTDSGPAHLANALGTHSIVLFGAGDEAHTAPYNEKLRTIIRLGALSCEPCEKNVCVRYSIPQCLQQLNTNIIVQTVKSKLDE